MSRACIGGPLVAYVDSLRRHRFHLERLPRSFPALHRIAWPGLSCFAVGKVLACCMAMNTTEQSGRKAADALDPTEAALVAMAEARQALDASLAATLDASADLVADCRLALAICTAWNPRGADTI